jgi:hypothetical protein
MENHHFARNVLLLIVAVSLLGVIQGNELAGGDEITGGAIVSGKVSLDDEASYFQWHERCALDTAKYEEKCGRVYDGSGSRGLTEKSGCNNMRNRMRKSCAMRKNYDRIMAGHNTDRMVFAKNNQEERALVAKSTPTGAIVGVGSGVVPISFLIIVAGFVGLLLYIRKDSR